MKSISTENSFIKKIFKLYTFFDKPRKVQFYLLICFMILASLLESIGIGLVIPLISVISDPGLFFEHLTSIPIIKNLDIKTDNQAVTVVFILFIIFTSCITLIKFLYSYSQMRFATLISYDLSQSLFKGALKQPYSSFLSLNESEFLTIQSVKVNQVLMNIIIPILTISSSIVLTLSIFVLLIVIDSQLSFFVIIAFLFLYFFSAIILRNRISILGQHISTQQNLLTKIIKNVFGSRKDIILSNLGSFYENAFNNIDHKLRSAHAKVDFYRTSPRYFVEYGLTIGFAVLSLIYFYLSSDDLQTNLAKLSAFALASIRVLPMVQNVFSSWFNLKTFENTLDDLLLFISKLQASSEDYIPYIKNIPFKKNIYLKNISLTYPKNKIILDKISLNINKGERLALMGKSGSGKSSLIDVIMGLVKPQTGKVLIDGAELSKDYLRSWMNKISHVPQEIFISENTIKENIAARSNVTTIDIERVNLSIKNSLLQEFISKQSNGIESSIGDGADPISGGEKQRLGIARALYAHDYELLVLDESTNAIDSKTERKILNNILIDLPEDTTVIMITHRKDTAQLFDKIYEVDNGKIKLIDKNPNPS